MILPDVHLSPNKTINTLASVPAPDLSPVLTSMLYVVVVMVDVTVSAGRTLWAILLIWIENQQNPDGLRQALIEHKRHGSARIGKKITCDRLISIWIGLDWQTILTTSPRSWIHQCWPGLTQIVHKLTDDVLNQYISVGLDHNIRFFVNEIHRRGTFDLWDNFTTDNLFMLWICCCCCGCGDRNVWNIECNIVMLKFSKFQLHFCTQRSNKPHDYCPSPNSRWSWTPIIIKWLGVSTLLV